MRLLVIACLLAGPAAAQDGFDSAATAACDAAGGGAACAVRAAEDCMPADPADVAAAVACLRAGTAWWQARLDAAQDRAMILMQARDSATWDDPPPSLAGALRDMQRAWLDYRDARCDLTRLRWWADAAAEVAHLRCIMAVTAAQVAVLDDMVAAP